MPGHRIRERAGLPHPQPPCPDACGTRNDDRWAAAVLANHRPPLRIDAPRQNLGLARPRPDKESVRLELQRRTPPPRTPRSLTTRKRSDRATNTPGLGMHAASGAAESDGGAVEGADDDASLADAPDPDRRQVVELLPEGTGGDARLARRDVEGRQDRVSGATGQVRFKRASSAVPEVVAMSLRRRPYGVLTPCRDRAVTARALSQRSASPRLPLGADR